MIRQAERAMFDGGDTRPREPVVITGIGAVTPLGNSFDAIATNLLAGVSGVRRIEVPFFGPEHVQFAAPVDSIPSPEGFESARLSECSRFEQICGAAVAAAVADGRLAGIDPRRIGIVAGIGAEQLKAWETDYAAGGTRVLGPGIDSPIVHRIATLVGIDGPAATVGAACASSGYAIAMARRWLQLGWVDACIAGGCDVITPSAIAAFHNLRALSRRSDDPARASRPFDRDRDGFVMGEGGAFVVLERADDAAARGAMSRAEVAGVGMSSDACHMVTPSTDSLHASRAMEAAMSDAAIDPDEVDYVNAHAAGTSVGDAAESAAIRMALGGRADRVPVSSTKSMSGHLVSGAAAFEAVACLAAMDRSAVPPTVNLDNPDEACRLDHVALVARRHPVRVALSNSFGFGGANLCLALRAA